MGRPVLAFLGPLFKLKSPIEKSPSALSRPLFFSDHFHMWQFIWHSLYSDLGWFRLSRFCLIELLQNEPFNKLINFGIPGLIFQVTVTKLYIYVGLNMLINTSSVFYHYHKECLAKFVRVFRHPSSQTPQLMAFSTIHHRPPSCITF